MKQTARDSIKIGDKQLNEELAKKMINAYCFTDRILKIALNITLDSHHINHAISTFTIIAKYLGLEKSYVR